MIAHLPPAFLLLPLLVLLVALLLLAIQLWRAAALALPRWRRVSAVW